MTNPKELLNKTLAEYADDNLSGEIRVKYEYGEIVGIDSTLRLELKEWPVKIQQEDVTKIQTTNFI